MSTYDKLLELEESHQPSDAPTPKKQKEARDNSTQKVTSKSTRKRNTSSDKPRKKPRKRPRRKSSDASFDLPTRDEIQEFSFRLRDELKSKVQAEVPHQWPKELEEIARELNVKKLELYRFILGEFLGKVKRKNSD